MSCSCLQKCLSAFGFGAHGSSVVVSGAESEGMIQGHADASAFQTRPTPERFSLLNEKDSIAMKPAVCFSSLSNDLSAICPDSADGGDPAQTFLSHVTLSTMPDDAIDHLVSFVPDTVRVLRAVSKAFQFNGEGFLLEHAGEIAKSRTGSLLYALMSARHLHFRQYLESYPHRSWLEFHLSIPTSIVSLGVPCPDKVLALQEMDRYNNEVQSLQDVNLQRIWEPLRQQIMAAGPLPAGIPDVNASVQEIRCWVSKSANQAAMQRITCLDLNHRGLTCVPLEIWLCTGLQELNLSHNQLTTLPERFFDGLAGLQRLIMTNNLLASLPERLFQRLAELQVLDLYSNHLTTLPPGLFQGLARLQKLSLGTNQLTTLPEELFQGLAELQCLSLSYNQLTTPPTGLFQGLVGLQKLFLENNQLASLPEGLFQGLVGLGELNLACNQLDSLPEGLFRGLVGLRSLCFGCNRLTTLAEGLFQGLTGLRGLAFSNNQLTTLPEGLLQGLTGLQKLYINNNQLATLPTGLFQGLTELRELSLSNNQLTTFPEGLLQGLTGLWQLSLSNNQLTTLPEGLLQGQAELQGLYLYKNQLATLPEGLFRGLAQLQTLYLYGNPQLLFFHNDLPAQDNAIKHLETIRTFFRHPCTSPLARVYQLVAGNASPEAVRGPFSQVPATIRKAILEKVWEESDHPNAADPKWRDQHAFDNMQIFGAALKRHVSASCWKWFFGYSDILRLIDTEMGGNSQ